MAKTDRKINRKYLESTFGPLYKRFYTCTHSECFYCGDVREHIDHRPPITVFNSYSPKDFRKAQIPLLLVPSCADCNKKLGNKPLYRLSEAAGYIMKALEYEYEKKHNMWDEDSIKEMSPMFQKMIRAKKQELLALADRVRFAQIRAYDYDKYPEYTEYPIEIKE